MEIGCGTGGLLRRFQEAGWNCEGIEPSTRLRNASATRLGDSTPIHSKRLEEADPHLIASPYDAVLGIDILEHLPDPRALPRSAYGWLKPGGRLFLQTPNAGSLRRYLQKGSWEQLAPEEHLFLHTRRSLDRLLRETGFEEVGIATISGSTTDSWGRALAMKPVGRMLGLLGLGNGLWAMARKGKE